MKPLSPNTPWEHLGAYRVNLRPASGRGIRGRLLGLPAAVARRREHWWSRTWQAEWDDAAHLGAFRGYTRTGALRRAIRAYRRTQNSPEEAGSE